MALWHYLVGGAAAYLLLKPKASAAASRQPTSGEMARIQEGFSAMNQKTGGVSVSYDGATNTLILESLNHPTAKVTLTWVSQADKFTKEGTYTGAVAVPAWS